MRNLLVLNLLCALAFSVNCPLNAAEGDGAGEDRGETPREAVKKHHTPSSPHAVDKEKGAASKAREAAPEEGEQSGEGEGGEEVLHVDTGTPSTGEEVDEKRSPRLVDGAAAASSASTADLEGLGGEAWELVPSPADAHAADESASDGSISGASSNDERHLEGHAHDPRITEEDRQRLTAQGYKLLQLIHHDAPDALAHYRQERKHVTIFTDKGSRFFTGHVTNHTPTLKTVWRWTGGAATTESETYERQAYLEDIISVAWALHDIAENHGEGFERGSFSVIDAERKLFDFLMGYVRLVGGESFYLNPFASNFAYSRNSSHYKGVSDVQYGIDMRFESTAWTLPLLPYGKNHILFARVRTKRGGEKTFIKFEENGLGDVLSIIGHTLDFAKPVGAGHVHVAMRREKDVPETLTRAFSDIFSHLKKALDELGERVQGRLAERGDLLPVVYSIWEKKPRIFSHTTETDMSEMYVLAQQMSEQFGDFPKVRIACLYFIAELARIGWEGDVQYRTGNEVVLSLGKDTPAAAHHLPSAEQISVCRTRLLAPAVDSVRQFKKPALRFLEELRKPVCELLGGLDHSFLQETKAVERLKYNAVLSAFLLASLRRLEELSLLKHHEKEPDEEAIMTVAAEILKPYLAGESGRHVSQVILGSEQEVQKEAFVHALTTLRGEILKELGIPHIGNAELFRITELKNLQLQTEDSPEEIEKTMKIIDVILQGALLNAGS